MKIMVMAAALMLLAPVTVEAADRRPAVNAVKVQLAVLRSRLAAASRHERRLLRIMREAGL